jgi:hypothetical protein
VARTPYADRSILFLLNETKSIVTIILDTESYGIVEDEFDEEIYPYNIVQIL